MLGPLLVSVAMLLALEAGLRLAGIPAHPAGGGVPLDALPLFQPATAPDGTLTMQRHDAPAVSFRREKPANGFRVFVVGDSPVFGFPFGPEFAFPRFLQERLAAAMPGRTVEVVNCGLNAIASWHARQIVEEVLRYAPDVIVVDVGHGDWITPSAEPTQPAARVVADWRIYQVAALAGQAWQRWRQGPLDVDRLRSRTDPFRLARERARGVATLTASERARIVERYAENLRAIVAAGRTVGATVILAGLTQNLSDFPPGASRHRHGLPDAERAQWREAIEQADARMRAQDYDGALDALQNAERIDPRPAILHYLRGRCLEALGRFAAAQDAYRTASDLDEAPLGAPTASTQVIQDVARQAGVQFIDVNAGLVGASSHGLLGNALFYDYVHPTVAGHAAIAQVLAAAMGAPGGDDRVTDVAALTAAHPEVQDWIYRANILLYIMLGWYDRAQAEVDQAVQQYPKLRPLHEAVETVRVKDPAPSWDDFPDAPD